MPSSWWTSHTNSDLPKSSQRYSREQGKNPDCLTMTGGTLSHSVHVATRTYPPVASLAGCREQTHVRQRTIMAISRFTRTTGIELHQTPERITVYARALVTKGDKQEQGQQHLA